MKKAVIQTGGRQFLVSEGDVLEVNFLGDAKKTTTFTPLMVIDGKDTTIGTPALDKAKVSAEIVEAEKQADKVTSIRYKAKKRVKTVKGHRQKVSVIKVTKIA